MPTAEPGDRRASVEPIIRVEVWIATLLAALSIGIIARMSDRMWFHSDAWDYLVGRDLSSVTSWIEPHAGHWQSPAVVVHLVLHRLVGMDYWPWYYLPRLVGFATFGLVAWYVFRKRGANRWFALGVLFAILVLPSSGWHNAATIGNLIAMSVAMLLTLWLPIAHPTVSDRWVVFALLLLAVVSTSLGVAVLAGTWLAIVVSRRRLALWWAPLAGASAIYATWLITYGSRSSGIVSNLAGLSPEQVGSFVWTVLQTGIGDVIGTDQPWMVGLVVVLSVIVVFRRADLDAGDLFLFATAGTYMALVLAARIATGAGEATAVRYGYNVVLLLAPLVIPRVPVPRGRVWGLAAAALPVAVGLAGLDHLGRVIDFWEDYSGASRQRVETAAALIAEGETFEPLAPIDFPRAGTLRAGGVSELVERGWTVSGSTDAEIVANVLGQLKIAVAPRGRVQGDPPDVAGPVDESGCVAVGAQESVSLDLQGPSTIRIVASDSAQIVITAMSEEERSVIRRIEMRPSFGGDVYPRLPAESATYDVSADTAVQVCGVEPAAPE